MTISKKLYIGVVALAIFALAVYVAWAIQGVALAGDGGVDARICTVTESVVSVGNQLAVTALSSYSNRAWARIYQPINATNTVSISYGGTATTNSGPQLTPATTTSPVMYSDPFGRNTDFAFVGAVTAITNTGSSTIRVEECRYNQ